MKKILALMLAAVMCFGVLAACGNGGDDDTGGATGSGSAAGVEIPTGPRGAGLTINLWSFTNELPDAVLKFKEQNPDFQYNINITVISDQDGLYEQALNPALMMGGSDAPDIYVVEQAFVVNYSKFNFASYAKPYEELFGTDGLNDLLEAAEIGDFIQYAGTNMDGKLVALGYQSTGSGFIYRRDLAEQIWGSGDPATVQDKIGPGWDKFMAAAEDAKAAGISIISGEADLWQAIRQSAVPWIVDGRLSIDAQREAYLDMGYKFYNEGFTNRNAAWSDPWFADMAGTGEGNPVLGYLGPAWLINYVIAGNSGDTFGNWGLCEAPTGFAWGGSFSIVNKNVSDDVLPGVAEIIRWITLDISDTGMQYQWANGLGDLGSGGDAVASAVVMERSNGSLEFLGGQDMFDIFVPAGVNGRSTGWGPFDRAIDAAFNDQATQYFTGAKTKDQAIADFRQHIADTLGIQS